MTVKQSIAGILAAAAIGGGVYEGTVSDGPVNVVREGELVSQRTETAVVYDMGNGKRRAEVSMKPVHWRDAKDMDWKTIDTAVKPKPILRQLVSSRDYETTAGPYTADYETEKPYNYRMVAGGASVAYTALFDTSKAVTVTVEPTTTGVKETVILADATAPTRLDWTVDTDVVFTARGDGGFVADGLTIEPPVAWDAKGTAVPVTASLDKGVYSLTVETKGAAFPVTVDPTTTVTSILDGYIASNNVDNITTARNATTGSASASMLRVGIIGTSTYQVSRSFLSFVIPEIDGISVDACSLYVNGNNDQSTADDSVYVFGAQAYRPTLDNNDFNDFNGWQAAGAYNGVKLTYGWYMSSYSADWNIMRFTPAGMDSLRAAQGDTLRLAMLCNYDYATGSTGTSVTVNFESSAHATLDPYLSIGYTGYDYNTTYSSSITPSDMQTSKADVNATYATVRNTVDVGSISSAAADTLGQMKDGANNYHVWRLNLEVTGLPEMNYAADCTLKINLTADQSATDFNLQVFEGSWTEPANADARYYLFDGHQSTAHNGTRLNNPWSTASYGAGVLNLVFNADGKAALVAASNDTLRLVVISSRDSSNTAPTGNEFLTVNTTSAALAFTWRLNSIQPTGLALTAVDTDSIAVSWTDNSLDETGFSVVETLTGNVVAAVGPDTTTVRIGGLATNKLYSWRVRVDGGVYDDSLSVADSTYTKAAAPVAKPALTFLTTSAAKVVIDTTGTGNPEWTEYAIQDSISGKYVDWISGALDTLRAAADWGTYGGWGGTAGDTLTVAVGKKYGFRVKARSDSLDSYSAVPTLLSASLDSASVQTGDELITNGDFSSWDGIAFPGDVPTGWASYTSRDASNYTENSSGAVHLVVAKPLLGILYQSICAAGKTYRGSINLTSITTGGVSFWNRALSGIFFTPATTPGTYSGLARQTTAGTHGAYLTNLNTVATDAVVDSASVKEYWLTDYGPNARHLSPANQPIWNTLASGLKVQNFNGTTSLDDTGADDVSTGAKTVEIWLRPETAGEGNVGRMFSNGRFITALDNTNGRISVTSDSTTVVYSGNTAWAANTWTHLMVTRTAAGVANIYVNGALSGTANQASGTPAGGTTNLFIGNNSAASATFDGDLSGVRIYDGILTATQIYNRYIDTRDAYR